MSIILCFFAVYLATLGRASATSGTSDCSAFPIQVTSTEEARGTGYFNDRDDIQRSTIRFTQARGVKIFGTDSVADYVIVDAARVIAGVMDGIKPELSAAIRAKNQRIIIANFTATDSYRGGTQCNPAGITNQASLFLAAGQCDERRFSDQDYGFMVHEFAHAINCVWGDAMNNTMDPRVTAAYENAKREEIWPADSYAMTSTTEYFAELFMEMWHKSGRESWKSKDKIAERDPMFINLYREILSGDEFEITCANRCDPRTIVGQNASPETGTSGKVVIIGGEVRTADFGGESSNTDTVEVFDASTKTFQSAGSFPNLPVLRRNFAVSTHGDVVYAIGGHDISLGSLTTNERINMGKQPLTWETSTPMPTARQALAVAASPTNIFAIGGHNGTRYLNTLESFDPTSGTWSALEGMQTPRRELAAGVVGDSLYAVGGFDEEPLSVVEKYETGSNQWSTASPMATLRAAPCAAVLAGKLYVMGGWNRRDGHLLSAEVYDPTSDTWERIANMNTKRKACGAATANGLIFVFGGYSPEFHASVEAYDAATDTWQTLTAKMDIARAYLGVAAFS